MADYDVEYTDMHQEDVFGQDYDRGELTAELNQDDDEYDDEVEDYDDPYLDTDRYGDFADPGGNSALRAATASNPRNLPCPTCGRKNVLTQKDVDLGYQCDSCADRAEGKYGSGSYGEY